MVHVMNAEEQRFWQWVSVVILALAVWFVIDAVFK
jgi:hypothetical protein